MNINFEKTEIAQNTRKAWQVLLDGKNIYTPLKVQISLPTQKLASLIALEWQQNKQKINPNKMPFTQIAATVIDKVSPQKELYVKTCVNFIHTDLLCYRSEEKVLSEIQEQKYYPILNAFCAKIGAELKLTNSILPITQNLKEVQKITQEIGEIDDWYFTLMFLATQNSSSIILGWAFVNKLINAEKMFELMFVDEAYQESYWGLDDEERSRRALILEQIKILEQFLEALND